MIAIGMASARCRSRRCAAGSTHAWQAFSAPVVSPAAGPLSDWCSAPRVQSALRGSLPWAQPAPRAASAALRSGLDAWQAFTQRSSVCFAPRSFPLPRQLISASLLQSAQRFKIKPAPRKRCNARLLAATAGPLAGGVSYP